jgi:ferric iron reductase protein FhuF
LSKLEKKWFTHANIVWGGTICLLKWDFLKFKTRASGETMETMRDFILGGSRITADGVCSMKLKDLCSLEAKL